MLFGLQMSLKVSKKQVRSDNRDESYGKWDGNSVHDVESKCGNRIIYSGYESPSRYINLQYCLKAHLLLRLHPTQPCALEIFIGYGAIDGGSVGPRIRLSFVRRKPEWGVAQR